MYCFSFLHRKLVLIALLLMAGLGWQARAYAASLRISWKDTSTNETGFKIERLSAGAFIQIGEVGPNVTSYTDSQVTVGTTYCYRVRAFNSAGSSNPSNQACANATETGGTVSLGETPTISSGTASQTAGSKAQTGNGSSTISASQVAGRWTDYRVSMKIRSTDDDSIGAMFRYVDGRNYYRFSWNTDAGFRRLEKIQNKVPTVLAQDTVPYVIGRTYQLEIVAQGPVLTVLIDGVRVFSVTDSSFDGGSIALYSYYNQGSSFDDVVVQDLAAGAVLLSNNFNDGNFVGWTIIDEGADQGPSAWSANSRALVQSRDIGSKTTGQFGTYALYTKGSWTDYRVTLKMRSSDNNSIGAMFRYVDNKNFYRFSWNVQEGLRRLEKVQNGVPTVLAKDSVRYVVGSTYQLEALVQGSVLNVLIDGAPVFSVRDSSFNGGTIALYSGYNQGSLFDDVVVQDLATGAMLLSENFNDGDFTGWTIIDEGTEEGLSIWSAKSGALVQNRDIGSRTTGQFGTYALY
ncbi:MAG TPA: fibronectin type III domain-containing protein [Candidatus Binatia bacterium]|jgi:hypothetical protein|nr:fibronectin type III domain-containing protein [Candidatus Binatia bacterium]